MTAEAPTGRWADLADRLALLGRLARQKECRAVVLSDPANLTWLLGGRVNVPQTLDSACLDAVVSVAAAATRLTIVTNRIEAPRLRDVELAGLDTEWQVLDWWESRPAALPTGADIAADRPTGASVSIAADLAAERRTFSAAEQTLLRGVCRDTAAAASSAAERLSPNTSEYLAAGYLAKELLARGLDPIVLLVAGSRHIPVHRHPLPTSSTLDDRAMLVACGRRHGLVASVTRFVSFGPLANSERDAYAAILRVEAAFLDATKAGEVIGATVRAGTRAYADQGFDPLE